MKISSWSALLVLLIFGVVVGQELPLPGQTSSQPAAVDLTAFTTEMGTQQFASVLKSSQLIRGVDPRTYRVDAGDQFIIKVDPKGPAIKIYQAMVTPEGMVLLPEAPSISVKHLLLSEARKRIRRVLRQKFPDAEVEVFLFQVHPITVTFASPLPGLGEGQFLSDTRLNSAVEYFVKSWQEAAAQERTLRLQEAIPPNPEGQYFKTQNLDSTFAIRNTARPALRRIRLVRNGKTTVYDLFRYRFLGETAQNPYLMNGDIVIIPAVENSAGTITVQGAVGNTVSFEYQPGDLLKEAIAFSGGLGVGADSSNIQVFRFQTTSSKPHRFRLTWPADSNFVLQAEDVIVIHPRPLQFTKGRVRVVGEVKYPGEYPIPDNRIHLREFIEQVGGFTDGAALKEARIYRTKFYKGEENLAIFLSLRPEDMDLNLLSYLGIRAREEVRVVACDFEKLFVEGDSSQNIALRDGDIIYVPQPLGIVYVSGAVQQPGTYPYRPNWSYEDYIAAAGGYTSLARKRSVRIIRGDTGVWLGWDKTLPIYAGDMIFVPEKTEIRWQTFMKDIAITLGQLATVALIMTRIFGSN